MAAAAAAPVAAAGVVANPITGVLGVGSTVVGLPFQVLGGIFPAGGAPRKGGVTAVRYVGTGAKQAEIDEGWTPAVPVDRSGPIYVVENGDPTISPITFIGRPDPRRRHHRPDPVPGHRRPVRRHPGVLIRHGWPPGRLSTSPTRCRPRSGPAFRVVGRGSRRTARASVKPA